VEGLYGPAGGKINDFDRDPQVLTIVTGRDGIAAGPGRPGYTHETIATNTHSYPGPVVLSPHIAVAAVRDGAEQAVDLGDRQRLDASAGAGCVLIIDRVK